MPDTYNRIAIITGTTSGIGEATTKKMIAEGFAVVGNGRNKDKLTKMEALLGPAFCGVAGDATDVELLEKLFVSAENRFGRSADIVVANAGRGLGGSIIEADTSQFEEMINLNVSGTLLLLQKAAQKMTGGQEKSFPDSTADIVIIGSVVGRHISPFSAVYSATKFAVHGMAESLRREIGPKGIRVSLVEPGLALTGFQSAANYSDAMVSELTDRFGPLLVGEDVANAIFYIVTRPPHVHISDIVVRPTRQDYP